MFMIGERLRLVARIAISLVFLVLVGCVGPAPLEDYNLAYTALQSARAAGASRFAPGYFNLAEEHYRKAVTQFEGREYGKAKESFLLSRKSAEKAENYTMLKKYESGENE